MDRTTWLILALVGVGLAAFLFQVALEVMKFVALTKWVFS